MPPTPIDRLDDDALDLRVFAVEAARLLGCTTVADLATVTAEQLAERGARARDVADLRRVAAAAGVRLAGARGRGRPPVASPKPRKSGPSGKSGKARPPSPEQVAAVQGLIRRLDPAGVIGGPALARVVGVEASRVSALLAGKRGVSVETLAAWTAKVEERLRPV